MSIEMTESLLRHDRKTVEESSAKRGVFRRLQDADRDGVDMLRDAVDPPNMSCGDWEWDSSVADG